MDRPRRRNSNKRFDSLQYLKLAVYNSWSLRPKESKIESTEVSKSSDTKIKAGSGCTFYYSVQDTALMDNDPGEKEDDSDDEDEIIEYLADQSAEQEITEYLSDYAAECNQKTAETTQQGTSNIVPICNSSDPKTYVEFMSEIDINKVSALNDAEISPAISFEELFSALESRELSITKEIDYLRNTKMKLEQLQDGAIFELSELRKDPNFLNANNAEILNVLQKSVDSASETEYLTFNINPLDNDSAIIDDNNVADTHNSALNQYVTLDLSDITNQNNDSALSTKDTLLSQNVVHEFDDFNELLNSATAQSSLQQWSSLEEFIEDFNALNLE